MAVGRSPEAKAALLDSGGLGTLLRLLRSTDRHAQVAAATALRNLAAHPPPSKAAIAEAGAVGDVVRLLGSADLTVQHLAAFMLRNLCDDPSDVVQRACARCRAAPALLDLLGSSRHLQVQEEAVTALRELAACRSKHRQAILRHPAGMQTLAQLADSAAAAGTAAIVQSAIETMRHLIFEGHSEAVSAAIPALLRCLRCSHTGVAQQAAAALADLARFDAAMRDRIAAAGGIAALTVTLPTKPEMSNAGTALRAICLGSREHLAAAARAMGMLPGHPFYASFI